MIVIKNVYYILPENDWELKKGDVIVGEDADNGIEEIQQRYNYRDIHEKIDGRDKVLMPSFTNAHTHAPMILFRGFAEGMILEDYLPKIFEYEERIEKKDVKIACMLSLIEMIKTGTTQFMSSYYYPEVMKECLEKLGMNGYSGIPIISKKERCAYDEEEHLKKAESLLKDDAKRYYLSPHSIYKCSEETLHKVIELSKKYNTKIAIHVSETRSECIECWKKNGCWPVEYLDKIKFLVGNLYIAHSSWITKMEISLLKKSGCKVIHCPTSNMKLASGGVMPLVELLNEGIEVYLGTDSPASNNSLNMINECKFAALIHKAHRWDPKVIDEKIVLNMATKKIPPFTKRDAILLDKNFFLHPVKKAPANIVYSGAVVKDVICNGKLIMRDGKIESVDEVKVYENFEKCIYRLFGE